MKEVIENVERVINAGGSEDENETILDALDSIARLELTDPHEQAIACVAYALARRDAEAEER